MLVNDSVVCVVYSCIPQKKFVCLCTSRNYCRSYHRMWTDHVNPSLQKIRPMKPVGRILTSVAVLDPIVSCTARSRRLPSSWHASSTELKPIECFGHNRLASYTWNHMGKCFLFEGKYVRISPRLITRKRRLNMLCRC